MQRGSAHSTRRDRSQNLFFIGNVPAQLCAARRVGSLMRVARRRGGVADPSAGRHRMRPDTRSSISRTSPALSAFSAASRKSCSSTSCWAWLPPSRYMPPSAGRISRDRARHGRPARAPARPRRAAARSRRDQPRDGAALPRAKVAHAVDHALPPRRLRPVAASAIIQCGRVKADRQSPIRASALSASSIQRSPTSTPWRSSRNSMEAAFCTSM